MLIPISINQYMTDFGFRFIMQDLLLFENDVFSIICKDCKKSYDHISKKNLLVIRFIYSL